MALGRVLFVSLVVIILAGRPTSGAELKKLTPPGFGNHEMLFLTGPIASGDGDTFDKFTKDVKRATVVLKSEGGAVGDALQIGARIRENNWATMVLPDDECYSACALIWIAGARRYMSQSSTIGFHAAYKVENGKMIETGMGNAEIGSFLTHLGLRIEAIRFITRASPEKVSVLTPALARGLGIEVYEQDGLEVTTPKQKPTVDRYAELATLSLGVSSQCDLMFDVPHEKLRRLAEEALKSGNKLVGSETFSRLLCIQTDKTKSEMSGMSRLDWCMSAVTELAKAGVSLTVRPSFACDKASSPTERAICSSPSLSMKDRIVSRLFQLAIKDGNPEEVAKFRMTQKQWLKMREACLSDESCIHAAYDMRMQQLSR